jgi:hypothetical protein
MWLPVPVNEYLSRYSNPALGCVVIDPLWRRRGDASVRGCARGASRGVAGRSADHAGSLSHRDGDRLWHYAGQTALYLDNPALAGNPFFRLVPPWAIYPMAVLATLATIIASQAIITGTFSGDDSAGARTEFSG